MLANEGLDFVDKLSGVTDERFYFPMALIQPLEHPRDRRTPPLRIVRRKSRLGEDLRPKLAGDDVHLPLDACELRLGLLEHLGGGEVRVQLQLELSRKLVFAQSPFPVRPRQEVVLQKLLIFLQAMDDLFGCGFQLAELRRLGGQLENAMLVERDRASILTDGRIEKDSRRIAEAFPRRRDNRRDVRHPGDAVLDVDAARQGRLRQGQEDAFGDVVVVDPRVLFEWVRILGEPNPARQVLLEDLEIDLPAPRKPVVMNFRRKPARTPRRMDSPARASRGGKIVEQVIETMVPEPGGAERPFLKFLIQISFEERGEFRILIARPLHQKASQPNHAAHNHRPHVHFLASRAKHHRSHG